MTTLSKLHQAFSDLVSWCRSGKDEDEASSDMMFESEDERKKLVAFFCRAMGPSCSTNNAGEILMFKVFFGYSNLVHPRSVQNGTDSRDAGIPPKATPPRNCANNKA